MSIIRSMLVFSCAPNGNELSSPAPAGVSRPTRFVLPATAQDFRRLSFPIGLEKIYASESLILSIEGDVSLFALSEPEVAAGIERCNQAIRHRFWRGSARRP